MAQLGNVIAKQIAEAKQSLTGASFDSAQGNAQAGGNLGLTQTFKVSNFEHVSFRWGQLLKGDAEVLLPIILIGLL